MPTNEHENDPDETCEMAPMSEEEALTLIGEALAELDDTRND